MCKLLRCAFLTIAFFQSEIGFADACRSQLPDSLISELSAKFPDYRSPLATDSSSEDIEWNIREGGKGCWRVAKADFDGNNEQDYVVGLSAIKGGGALVVVALAKKGGWQFHALDTWQEGGIRLFVAAAKPGTVTRTEALAGPVPPGEELLLTCSNWFAEFGGLESSAVDYCYTKKGWRYTWTSD